MQYPFSNPTDAEVAPLWSDYLHTRSAEARNALVVAYKGLVDRNATQIVSRLPAHVDPDDYVSVGTMGLMKAIAKFDPSRNTRFTTYATQKIRGAVLDELRSIDPIPRLVRVRS